MDLKKKLRNHSLITGVLFALLALRQVVYTFSMLVGYPAEVLISYTGISQPLWFLSYALIAVSVFLERKDGLTVVGFAMPVVLLALSLIFSDGEKSLVWLSLVIHGVTCFVIIGMMYLPKCRALARGIWFVPAELQMVCWVVADFVYPAVTGLRIGSAVYLLQAAALLFAGMWAVEFDAEDLIARLREKLCRGKSGGKMTCEVGGSDYEADRNDCSGGDQGGTK